MSDRRSLKRSATGLLVASVLAGLLWVGVPSSPADSHYPQIRAAALEVEITPLQLDQSESVVIEDSEGKQAYRLTADSISLDGKAVSSIQFELNDLAADAADPETMYEPDLLNPDRLGHGAGQRVFHPKELCPRNRDNPLWGAVRVFTLRRMKIEVRISDIQMDEKYEGITGAHIKVNVTPSPSTRSRPVDVPYEEPKPCV